MKKILITEPMHQSAVGRLCEHHEVLFDPTLFQRPEELQSKAADVHALIVKARTQVDAGLLRAMKQCRVVGRLGVGLDNIDTRGCANQGIEVIPAIGCNARSVAEYVITTAMILLRGGIYTVTREMASGAWPRPPIGHGFEIADKTLGIIGYGSIGRATARLAQAIGMRVIAFDPKRCPGDEEEGVTATTLSSLLAQSDVVSLHLPLNAQTRGMIGEAELAQMKSEAVLINAARGGMINDAALVTALREGRIFGAAIDVFEIEPLQEGTVYSNPPPNLLLTPHMAGVTAQAELRVCYAVADGVLRALQG